MLLAFYLCAISCFQMATVIGQPSVANPLPGREVDPLLQDYAFQGFVNPKTGIIYNGSLPSNLAGIQVAAVRLRSGSLRRKGFASFNEFHIPVGLLEQPYVLRLVLVYHNFGNLSATYYPLPGYTFLAPVLGLLAYDAVNLSATNLPELNISPSRDPISITFPLGVELNASARCVCFPLNGSVEFQDLVRNNTCLTTKQGHFSIVVRSSVSPPIAHAGRGSGKRVWIIAGGVIGSVVLLAVLALLFCFVRKWRRRKRVRRMEEATESGVPLSTTSVGYTRAPVALETRTRPVLETEFVA